MIDRRLRNTALLVAGCFFMELLDGTIVVTAIPQMSRSLNATTSSTALVITAYLLTLAALIPLSGWMTARYGPRRMFLSAITLFTLASLGCALSTNLTELVVLRIAQGAGAAMMVPVGRLVVLGPAPKSSSCG
jgi:Arabinose efflux permease